MQGERSERRGADKNQDGGSSFRKNLWIGACRGGRGYATRRIPETKSYRSCRMRGNSAVIGRLPDNNPSRRGGRGCCTAQVVNRRHSLCNGGSNRSRRFAGNNGTAQWRKRPRVIKALGNKVNKV